MTMMKSKYKSETEVYTKSQDVVPFHYDDEVLIYNKITKVTCSIGIQEYSVLEKYTDSASIEEVAIICNLPKEQINELTSLFLQHGLLDREKDAYTIKTAPSSKRKKHTLIYGDNWIIPITSPFLAKTVALLLWLSIPFLIIAITISRGKIDVNTIIQSINIIDILWIDVILSLSIFLHELAHAFSAKLNGAHIGEIGVVFDIITPLAYTTICGIHKTKSKYHKIKIYFAGIAVNLYIAGGSLLISKATNGILSKYSFMAFGTNFCISLINSLLLFDTDLFKIFTIVSGCSDCRGHLINAVKSKNMRSITAWEWLLIVVGYIIEPAVVIILLVIAIKKTYGG